MHYLYLGDGFEPVAQERTWMGEPPHWTGGPLDPNHPEYIDPDQPSEAYERTHLYYYHVDHIGTPIEVTDEAGHVAWHAQYKAWGEAKEVLSATAKRAGFKNPLRFQGQYHDEESGLHYNRFRYYDPELGRYISEDPIRLRGGLNTYQYAPNPVEWVDSLGLQTARQARINELAEANAFRRLQEMEASSPCSHFLERHGAQTSLASQERRAADGTNPTTGLPDDVPSAATRFDSHRDQLNTIQRAQVIRQQTGTTQPINVSYGRRIGEGYNQAGTYNTSSTAKVVFNNQTGAVRTAYPIWGQ